MAHDNERWQENVFPRDYTPPKPRRKYDLVVIGGGTAGLVTAAGAAGLGARVALIEAQAMGGDCLNVGCVPSKALIAGAKKFNRIQQSGGGAEPKEAFSKALEQVWQKRAAISVHDSVSRFNDLGVDVFLGRGRFTEEDRVAVGEQILRYKKAVIAVGARASAPPIPGLGETPYLTNENLFTLAQRPDRLTIIGAGPIGVEMAQAFARFGTEVHLVEVAPKILIREDQKAAAIIEKTLVNEGVIIHTEAKINKISGDDVAQRVELVMENDQITTIESDKLLIAAGRKPNTSDLGLENVGVELDKRGWVVVDDRLRSTNKKIYACGDAASPYQFTHAADFLARIVIQNSLFFGRKKASGLIIPWVTYSEPEIAHVGYYGHELDEKNIAYTAYSMDFSEVDRSLLEDNKGFCEILADPKKGTILGATIIHDHAGEMISQITQAMQHSITLGKVAAVMYPYPTEAEIIRKIGDQFNRSRLTTMVKTLLKLVARF